MEMDVTEKCILFPKSIQPSFGSNQTNILQETEKLSTQLGGMNL